ncbi:ANTAR domain-containing protein [Streptomyces sp. NPDC010273]|uniref:ANTAR domain-containing protein n=1 Tax=Streptomyces sp. NPDC010273 TaxID=3364829 RepID=UPI0036E01330
MTHPAGIRTVLSVSGETDADTEEALQRALRLALARSSEGVDLDLAEAGFCDCSGLNVLLRVRLIALADGKTLAVRAVSPVAERLFALTDPSSLFTHARTPVDGIVHHWHEHSAATHGLMEENGVCDDTEELRVEVAQHKRAMLTRPVIDLARGVPMASFGLSPDDAWSVLVDVSQHTNTPLHRLAEQLVDSLADNSSPGGARAGRPDGGYEVVGAPRCRPCCARTWWQSPEVSLPGPGAACDCHV